MRHLKDSAKTPESKKDPTPKKGSSSSSSSSSSGENENFEVVKKKKLVGSFEELGATEEVMGAVR